MKQDHTNSATGTDVLSKQQLEQMIECYFACTLDEQQEATLMRLLAESPHHSDAIDEARVVMGYYSLGKSLEQRQHHHARHYSSLLAAAAAVAVLIGVALAVWHHQSLSTTADQCLAYVNGKVVTDADVVLNLLSNDLDAVGDAQAAVEDNVMDQLHSIGTALDEDN